MPTNNGFVKIHRKILENPVVCKDSDYFAVWCYLLLKATHKEINVENCGETKTLKAGQLITGCQEIGTQFNVNQKKVQRILERFESERMIDQITYPRKGRIITILNWSDYQDSVQINDRIMSECCPNDVRIVSNNKNVKNDKNVKNVKNNNKAAPLVNPPFSGTMLDKVNEWLQYKRERKQSYKQTGLSALFRQIQSEIDKHGETFVISVIDKSIMNNWNGLFFDSSKQSGTSSDDYFLRVARGEINI